MAIINLKVAIWGSYNNFEIDNSLFNWKHYMFIQVNKSWKIWFAVGILPINLPNYMTNHFVTALADNTWAVHSQI